ncbi:CBN-SPTL-2 protein [Aphelenchoides avenae]|nr:CBN-SPTL-2 protein [Aphelenchus avenae]
MAVTKDLSDKEVDLTAQNGGHVSNGKHAHLKHEPAAREANGSVSTTHAPNEFETCHPFWTWTSYMTWMLLMVIGKIREFMRSSGIEKIPSVERQELRSFTPLYNFKSFEGLYIRNVYTRVRHAFERTIGGVPGGTVTLCERVAKDIEWTIELTGTQTDVVNVGSYNYLGFAQNDGPCAKNAAKAVEDAGISLCTTVHEQGMSRAQNDLEKLLAEFLGVDAAICFGMGFATNSMNLSCLVDKDSLIVSDQLNHASLILGACMSGATKKVFKHNDMKSLERVIRNSIAEGNTKAGGKPFNKILIIVEGVYSMEGSICNLPAIIALKKKYGCYIYLDEAHSIGAMGSTGRGVVQYWGCDPKDVDILMGTFSKSFGASGGYIAGTKR